MPDAPVHPYRILAASLVLPGSGHVWLGQAQRGLMFLFFTVVLGWVSTKLMPEHASFVGRHIGGVFVYGVCVLDAYRLARLRYEVWRKTQPRTGGMADPT